MSTEIRKTERRAEALSKDRIVEAAIAILDAEGEAALTFRALSARLATGSGAIYWHVADKQTLLAAATDAVIEQRAERVADGRQQREPRAAIRDPDAGGSSTRSGPALGRRPDVPRAVAVRGAADPRRRRRSARGAGRARQAGQFNAATALLNFILGVAGQNSAAARLDPRIGDRTDFLAAVAAQWTRRDPARYPFLHRIAGQLAGT
jgi:AcrR family transcriptional regulator